MSAVGEENPQIAAIQNVQRVAEIAADEAIAFREGGETLYGSLVPFGLDSNDEDVINDELMLG